MLLPDYSPRDLLAANLRRLMDDERYVDKSSPKKLAKVSFWPSGSKAGKPLSERQVRYMLDTSPDSPSPSLDAIVAVGNAFKIPAWQLLVDDRAMRKWMVGKLFTAEDGVPDAEVEKHLPLPPIEQERRQKR